MLVDCFNFILVGQCFGCSKRRNRNNIVLALIDVAMWQVEKRYVGGRISLNTFLRKTIRLSILKILCERCQGEKRVFGYLSQENIAK